MTRLSFNGALATVGASAIFVETETEKIVLDYGTKVKEIPPVFPIPIKGKPDVVVASHCHLDHIGGLPIFYKKTDMLPIYSLPVTKPLAELLLFDSVKIQAEYSDIEGTSLPFDKEAVRKTIKNFIPVNYKQPFKIHETEITFFDAGHIPGSAFTHLNFGKKSLLYTGDFKTIETRLMRKADLKLPEVNFLITESTYSDREHPDRKQQEKELNEIVQDTLANDAVAIISGFAVGRIQEILLVLANYGIDFPVYIDGMAKKATTIINQHKNLIRSSDILDKALENVQYVASDRMRRRIIRQPCVILTTSGMLSGGPVVQYIKKLYADRNASLILTGWQMEDTPGKILLETGRFVAEDLNLEVRMFVKRFDFSAHAGKTELFDFIKNLNPEKVFCIHGDHTEEFAQELKESGFDAVAPVANNRIFKL